MTDQPIALNSRTLDQLMDSVDGRALSVLATLDFARQELGALIAGSLRDGPQITPDDYASWPRERRMKFIEDYPDAFQLLLRGEVVPGEVVPAPNLAERLERLVSGEQPAPSPAVWPPEIESKVRL